MFNFKDHPFIKVMLFIGIMTGIKFIPVAEAVNLMGLHEKLSSLIESLITDGALLVFSIWVILQNNFHKRMGFFQPKMWNNLIFLALPLYFIPIVWFVNNPFSSIYPFPFFDFFSNLSQDLLTGLEEEAAFRGVILMVFISNFTDNKRGYLKSVLISSVLFALVHLLNLFVKPEYWPEVLAQMISAFMLGLLFCALVIRTQALILVGFVHGLLNFTLGIANIFDPSDQSHASPDLESMLISGLARFIISLPCLLIGLYLISNKYSYLGKDAAL